VFVDKQEALRIKFELILEQSAVREVTDKHEHGVGLPTLDRAGLDVARLHGLHLALAVDAVEHGVEHILDLLVLRSFLLQELPGAELIAAMHDPHAFPELSQEDFPNLVRKSASWSAESPPPTTRMSFSLKKNPSQVAQ